MSNSTISLTKPDPSKVWEDKNARSVSFFCKSWPVYIDHNLIEELKSLSKQRGNCNVRLCLHDGPNSTHQDMIILERDGHYPRPHMHITTGETFNVIEGEIGLCLFDDDGNILETNILYPGDVYRMGTKVFHSLIPLTEIVIYHESKPGPFHRENNLPASWAPDGTDNIIATKFLQKIKKKIVHK